GIPSRREPPCGCGDIPRRRRHVQEEVRGGAGGAGPPHGPAKVKQTVSYAGEVTAFVEPGRLRKIAGVKTKELFLWLSVVEVYVESVTAPGKVTFKTGTGLSDTFDAAAFALGE
uniref:Uncharacterized protein n=1 Tax=Aegilops tauschii subsp. strangulata TaxID=200361 RepID=A0A453J6F2_AEGTS